MGWSSKCRGWCQRTASTRRFWPPGGASAHSTSISSGHASAARRRVGSACPTWPPAARPGGDRVLARDAGPAGQWLRSSLSPRHGPVRARRSTGGRTVLARCPFGRLPLAPLDLPDVVPDRPPGRSTPTEQAEVALSLLDSLGRQSPDVWHWTSAT